MVKKFFLILHIQILGFQSLQSQSLILNKSDSLHLSSEILIDYIETIGNSNGDVFYQDFDEDVYFAERKTGFNPIKVNHEEYFLIFSLSKHKNHISFYGTLNDDKKLFLYDIEESRVIKSVSYEKKYYTTLNFSAQDADYVFTSSYYFNHQEKNKGYDLVRLYKYSKAKNKIIKKQYLDIGPESTLGSLGYQMVGHLDGLTYVATPLSGMITILDENLKVKDQFYVDSTIAEKNRPFFDEFLSSEKLNTYFRNPRTVILNFKSQIPKELEVLTRILPLSNGEILLQYSDPNDARNYSLYLYNRKKNQKSPIYNDPKFKANFYLDLSLNEFGDIQTIHLESDSLGKNYYLISSFALVGENQIVSKHKFSDCDSSLLKENTQSILLLDLPTYCKGCYNQEAMKNTLYIAPYHHIGSDNINHDYLKKSFKASLKISGEIIYVNEDVYNCLKGKFQPNELYYLEVETITPPAGFE